MTTENYLIRAENYYTTTPPKKELMKPKLRLFEIDESLKIYNSNQTFSYLIKNKQIEKSIFNTITKCKCMKSKCQKSYCECLAIGKACNIDCNCVGCNNSNCGCNSRKPGCLKKYCECYLKKQRCTFLCNCIDCCNQEDSESENEQLQQQSGLTITHQITQK